MILIAAGWAFACGASIIAFAEGFDVEQTLVQVFGHPAPPDLYDGLNRIASGFVLVFVTWCALLIAYFNARLGLEAAALIAGIFLGCVFAAPAAGDFSDPEWFTILAVILFSQTVGIVVSISLFVGRWLRRLARSEFSNT